MAPLIIWYFSIAFFLISIGMFWQNLKVREETRRMYEDIFAFRRELIKLAAKDRKRRF